MALRSATLDSTWAGLTDPSQVGGFGADYGSPDVSAGLSPGVTAATAPGLMPPWYSPDNPVFWVGVVIALGTGLIAVSTHWKIGKHLRGDVAV
jgi:hypothetical protein